MAKNVFIYFLISCTLFMSCTEYGRVTRSGTVDEKYEAAMKYYGEGQYYRTSTLMEGVIPYISGRDYFDVAIFTFADSYFQQGNYFLASHFFQRFIDKFPRHERVQEAEYYQAKSLYYQSPKYNLDQTETIKAIDTYQTFLNKYPTTEYKDECNRIVDELNSKLEKKAYENAKLQFKIKNYKAAVASFTSFAKNYPISSSNEELAFLKIKSQYELAKISLDNVRFDEKTIQLKKERYEKVVEYYFDFIDKYENSKYKTAAEGYYNSASNI